MPSEALKVAAQNIQLSFVPEKWQQDLIAKINQNKSILVSGKFTDLQKKKSDSK